MPIARAITMLLISLAASVSASAKYLSGSFAFRPSGTNITFTGATLGHAKQLRFEASNQYVVYTLYNEEFSGSPNDFYNYSNGVHIFDFTPETSGDLVKMHESIDLPLASTDSSESLIAIDSFLEFGSNTPIFDTSKRWAFDLVSLSRLAISSNTLTIFGHGTLHDRSGEFGDTAAEIEGVFTYFRNNLADFSMSVSAHGRGAQPIPEPSQLAMLCAGLCVLFLTASRSVRPHSL